MGRELSDETYVLGLCDEVLGECGKRQHRFDWLLGDPGRSGNRVRLPVDAYWPGHRLVVEYRELQHERPNAFFDKPDRLTASGVHRGQQRALYDARRDTLIPQHGLRLVVIRLADLAADARGRLRRRRKKDLQTIRSLVAPAPGSALAPPAGTAAPAPSAASVPSAALPPHRLPGGTGVKNGAEERVVAAFRRWLTARGWTSVPPTDPHSDIEAVRGGESLIGEAKGHTSAPGTDLDTAYGQLLRRMTSPDPAVRYAIVVPAPLLPHAQRVPAAVRRLLRIDLYAVSDDGEVEHIRP